MGHQHSKSGGCQTRIVDDPGGGALMQVKEQLIRGKTWIALDDTARWLYGCHRKAAP